ncbi:unnamed protein product [Pleuronectes platessa]|uniref:Uncharacterized protein n=1 Tax=Pleuronectes platessa TaxID=8262 RepID=A0A9N7YCG5_PLEPL|nr:unnamed protein product [Pleuronectes platessa]
MFLTSHTKEFLCTETEQSSRKNYKIYGQARLGHSPGVDGLPARDTDMSHGTMRLFLSAGSSRLSELGNKGVGARLGVFSGLHVMNGVYQAGRQGLQPVT